MDPERECCDHLFYRAMAYDACGVSRPDVETPPPGNRLASVYDEPYFARFMHRENGLGHQPPYSWRVATPLLACAVGTLAGSIEAGFRVLTVVSLGVTAFLLGLLVQRETGSVLLAGASIVACAGVFQMFRFPLYDYMLCDPLAFALLLLGLLLAQARRDGWFFAVAVLGVLNRETHLFVLPSYAVRLWLDGRLAWPRIAACLAVVGVWLAVRWAVPVPVDTYSLRTAFLAVPPASKLAGLFLLVFGTLAVSAGARLPQAPGAWWLLPAALAPVASAAFAANQDRAIAFAFPLVFLATFGFRTSDPLARALAVAPAVLFVLQRAVSATPVPAAPWLAAAGVVELAFVLRRRHSSTIRWPA